MRHNRFLRIAAAAGAVSVIGLGFPGHAAAEVTGLSIEKFGKAGTGCLYKLTATVKNVPPGTDIQFWDDVTFIGNGVLKGDVATIEWKPTTASQHTLMAKEYPPGLSTKSMTVDVGRGLDLGSLCMGL